MAFSELETKRCERDIVRFMERRRPPLHIRPLLDLGSRITGQSVAIFEVRPRWDREAEILEIPVAKVTYVRTKGMWRIFWMRKDRRWHAYQPHAEARSLAEALAIVDRDEHCCFFG